MFDFIFGNTATVTGAAASKEIIDAYADARNVLHGVDNETDCMVVNVDVTDNIKQMLSTLRNTLGDNAFNTTVIDTIANCMDGAMENARTNIVDHIVPTTTTEAEVIEDPDVKTFNTAAELCCIYNNVISKNQCISESMRTDDFNLIWEYYKLSDKNIAIVRNMDPSLMMEPTEPISVYRGWLIITHKSETGTVYELYDCNTRTIIVYSTSGELPEKLSHYNYDAVVLNNEPRNPLSMFEEEPLGEIVLSHQVQVSTQPLEHEEHTVGEIMAAANGNRRKAKS